jgi:Arc-like DNA binding domain
MLGYALALRLTQEVLRHRLRGVDTTGRTAMPKTVKAAGGGKRYALGMRTTRETRERMEAAAIANGRSLAQEVEARLEASFRQEDAFGGADARRMAILAGAAFITAARGGDWRTDPVAYTNGVAGVLDALLIGFPNGDVRELAIEALIGRLLSRLHREKREPAQEAAA